MTEATPSLFRQLDVPASPREPALSANDAALRWTPGPDELRLPSDEKEPKSSLKFAIMMYSFYCLREQWRRRQDVFVGADQFVHWDPDYDSCENPANFPPSPDSYVAFGVANRLRLSYVVWEEGKPPDFALEIVPPAIQRREEKKLRDIYAKMGVPDFFLYNPETKRIPALTGFELRDGRYRPLPEERVAQGIVGIRSKVLKLYLCVRSTGPGTYDSPLSWYDPATGRFLPTSQDLVDGILRRAERRAAAEKERAEAAKKRAEAAERELARLRLRYEAPQT